MTNEFEQGWKTYTNTVGAELAARAGQELCQTVESSIQEFKKQMYEMVEEHGNLGIEQCKGFVAEAWQAGTFNIDATLKGSASQATTVKSNGLGSVDVTTNFGHDYSMKYLANSEESAKAQAMDYQQRYQKYLYQDRKGSPLSFDEFLEKYGIENKPEQSLKSVYNGQYRVIPKEQLEAAKAYLRKKMYREIGTEGPNRALVSQKYLETLEKLTDRITDGNVESIPLDSESAKVIVDLCRSGEFNPESFGVSLSELIRTEYILQQAFKAGYTAAVMSLALELAPQICDLIIHLIKNGEIDPVKLKAAGLSTIEGGVKAFISGYVSKALTIACETGKLGEKFVKVSGNEIAAVVVLFMNTVQNAFLVATGKMTAREMEEKTEDAAVISIGGLIGGYIGVAILPQIAVVGYLVGSFVGSVIGTFVAKGKNALIMALCANTGITLFGIVDQNYALSDEMIRSLGISIAHLHLNEPNYNDVHTAEIHMNEPKYNEPHYLDIKILRRGVIGIRRIGYVM